MLPVFSLGSLLAVAALWPGVVGVSLPSCQKVAPSQRNLSSVRTARLDVPNDPFGLVYALHEDIAFVSLEKTAANSTLGVLNTNTFPPTLLHQISLPPAYVKVEGALGITLTHDGRYVIVSAGPGAIIVSVERAIAGRTDAVVGALNGTTEVQMPGVEAVEVTVTKDDKYAFVSQEYGVISRTRGQGNIDVFKLDEPNANGSVSGTPVGYLELGYAVVGTALSPDGRILYAVSETSTANDSTDGFLSVIDVHKLKSNPSKALISNVTAGCGPVRILVSHNGKTVWVTARESNHLLAFDAEKLLSDPSSALLASIQVGTAPVGLTFAKNETRILTADSNRFDYANATTGLSVVDVDAALSGKQAVLGQVPTGTFPREFAASPDGDTLLVALYGSGQVQSLDVATLP